MQSNLSFVMMSIIFFAIANKFIKNTLSAMKVSMSIERSVNLNCRTIELLFIMIFYGNFLPCRAAPTLMKYSFKLKYLSTSVFRENANHSNLPMKLIQSTT